mgnify:CR=1 FL=1
MTLESWTIAAIAALLALIVGIWKSIDFLSSKMTSAIKSTITTEIKPLDEKIDTLQGKIDSLAKKVDDVDMNSAKDFLIARLGEVERGGYLDEITKQRFYEDLDRYEKMGGDGYIHVWYDNLRKQDPHKL